MKYWITGLLSFAVLIIVAVYIFIPGTMTITTVTGINASEDAAFRLLIHDGQWHRWWPQKKHSADSPVLSYNGGEYSVGQKMFRSVSVNIHKNGRSYRSALILLPLRSDSFAIEWKTELRTGTAPLQRYRNYREGNDLQHDLHVLLAALKPFLEKTDNLYEVPITETTIRDSIILMGTLRGTGRPTTAHIYEMVYRLQKLAEKSGADTTNYPMLNIDSTGPEVVTRIGIPIDRKINVTGTGYVIKRLVPGNVLVAEVKGGPYTSKNVTKQIELYMNDYQKRSSVIPFESLLVDRSREPDTSKWVSRIYYPLY